MRRTIIATLAASLMFAAAAAAQVPIPKSATPDAKRADLHYKLGWEAIRAERWDEAIGEFKQSIDADPKFGEAYYALGRAQMGKKDFRQAIDAYLRCKEVFTSAGGERFANDLEYKRHLEDRILQYQTALNQARQPSGTGAQSKQLYIRELQMKLNELEQARDRSINVTIDSSVPYYVSTALGAAFFRNNQFADAEREYKAALDANSESGETHNNLAVLYLLTERAELAQAEVKLAEQTGYKVNPGLKDDIGKKLKRSGS
jgi:tetratricopeptide (TPR) repeat protein